jgi:phage-related tail protein
MATDDSNESKPLGFSIDIGEILKDVAGTRRRTTTRRTTSRASSTDMDAAVRRAVRAELQDVGKALRQLADEIVRLRRANEDLADKVAKLTRR